MSSSTPSCWETSTTNPNNLLKLALLTISMLTLCNSISSTSTSTTSRTTCTSRTSSSTVRFSSPSSFSDRTVLNWDTFRNRKTTCTTKCSTKNSAKSGSCSSITTLCTSRLPTPIPTYKEFIEGEEKLSRAFPLSIWASCTRSTSKSRELSRTTS